MRIVKRRILSAVVTGLALALGIFVMADRSASGQATSADIYGVGGGQINVGGTVKYAKFAFSGHMGPQGDFGSFRWTIEDPDTPLDVHVAIDCVNVSAFPPGAGGWMGGAVKKVTPQPNLYGTRPGDQVLFGINDFGEPSDPMADELNFYPGGGQPQICKTLTPMREIPIDQGNIVIKIE